MVREVGESWGSALSWESGGFIVCLFYFLLYKISNIKKKEWKE